MSDVIFYSFQGSIAILALTTILGFVRLFKGPSLTDRIIVFELIAAISVGLFTLLHFLDRSRYFLDAALMMCIVSFVSALGFAYFVHILHHDLDRKSENKEDS